MWTTEREMRRRRANGDTRTRKRIEWHYEVEKELANRLRDASQSERQTLYTTLYDELFRRVPDHPMLTRKQEQGECPTRVVQEMKFLRSFLKPNYTFLELGPGDCKLAIQIAKRVRHVYAVDVSTVVTDNRFPPNVELLVSDGTSVPVPENSVNVAYSNQLMEHIHPDDAIAQLKNIYRALVPGGMYICITPNRLTGPHDVSEYFDDVATGLHLREYTNRELEALFTDVGFSKTKSLIKSQGYKLPFLTPVFPLKWLESLAADNKLVAANLRRPPLSLILRNVKLVAIK